MSDVPVLEKLDWAARLLFAQGVLFGLLVLNLIGFAIPYTGEIRPMFVLMAVYYWAIYRPTLVPPFVVFALGIVMDIISDYPLGMNAFVLLAVQWSVRRQRVFLMGQSYGMVWIGWAAVCALAACLHWLLFSLFSWQVISPQPAISSVILSIGLYPLVTLILIGVHRILPVASGPFRSVR